jgi:hypothetical protein
MILGVFRKVTMRARLGNRLDDARTLFLLAPTKLFLKLGTLSMNPAFPHVSKSRRDK